MVVRGAGSEKGNLAAGEAFDLKSGVRNFNRKPVTPMNTTHGQPYRTWMCLSCGFIYDEATGLPDENIPPGTRWEDLPINWSCPDCGARKEDFELIAI